MNDAERLEELLTPVPEDEGGDDADRSLCSDDVKLLIDEIMRLRSIIKSDPSEALITEVMDKIECPTINFKEGQLRKEALDIIRIVRNTP